MNHNTGEYCDMEWKERGWSGKNACMVTGYAKTAAGDPCFKIDGKYTESATITDLHDIKSFEEQVWKMRTKPEGCEGMY